MKGLLPTQKVLCLYVDNGLSFAVQLKSYKKNPVVEKCFVIDTPFDTVSENGCIKVSDIFTENFKLACKQNNVTAESVVFSVNTGRLLNREIVIPAISTSKIDTLLQTNSSDYFPIDVSNYKMVHRVIEVFSDNSGKHMRLSVCAIPLDIIISYYTLAAALNLKVRMIDYAGNSVFQFVKAYDRNFNSSQENPDVVNVYVSLSSSGTTINFVKNGAEKLQRCISIGYGRLLKTACEEYDLSASALTCLQSGTEGDGVFNVMNFVNAGCMANESEKELLKNKKTSKGGTSVAGGDHTTDGHMTWEEFIAFGDADSGKGEKDAHDDEDTGVLTSDISDIKDDPKTSVEARSDGMEMFASALIRSMDYFSNFPENANAEYKVYILGFGGCFEGMSELISQKIGMEVEEISFNTAGKNICGTKNAADAALFPNYSVCIGSVIQPIDFTDKRAELAAPAIEVFRDSGFQSLLMLIGGAIFAICIAVAVCLWFIPRSRNSSLKQQYAELNDKIKALSSSNTYYNEHEKWVKIRNEINGINNYIYTKNDKLVYFMEEFERKMPSSFKTSRISISEDGVSMTITVDSRYEAAYVIMTLREMKSIDLISVSNSFTFGDISVEDDDFVTITDSQYDLIKTNLEGKDWLTFDLTELLDQKDLFNYFGISVGDYINKDGTLNHKNLDSKYKTLSDDDIRKGLDDGSIDFFDLFRIKKISDVGTDKSEGMSVSISVSMKYTGQFEIPAEPDATKE